MSGAERTAENTPIKNVPIPVTDTPALVAFALANQIDLVIIGPEGPFATNTRAFQQLLRRGVRG